MKLGRAVDVKDADVGPFSNDPPKMTPFAGALQLRRTLVLLGAEVLDFRRFDVVGNANGNDDVKEHRFSQTLSFFIEMGLLPVIV